MGSSSSKSASSSSRVPSRSLSSSGPSRSLSRDEIIEFARNAQSFEEYCKSQGIPYKSTDAIQKEAIDKVMADLKINPSSQSSTNRTRNTLSSDPSLLQTRSRTVDAPSSSASLNGGINKTSNYDGLTNGALNHSTKTSENNLSRQLSPNIDVTEANAKEMYVSTGENKSVQQSVSTGENKSVQQSVSTGEYKILNAVNKNEDSTKHVAFLKKLAVSFNANCHLRNKGFYCSVCDLYGIYYNFKSRDKHDETDFHKENMINKQDVKMRYCSKCRANFFGDVTFWIDHLETEFHKYFADFNKECNKTQTDVKKKNKDPQIDASLKQLPSMSVLDALSSTTDLKLTTDIADNFYNKLLNKDAEGAYCFYCHACQLWTACGESWEQHNLKHQSDLKFRETLQICSDCRVIVIGSKTLKKFHSGKSEHESFEKFLSESLNSMKNISDDKNCKEDDFHDPNKKNKKSALLLKGLPRCTKKDVFDSMKDFSRVDKIIMNFACFATAKVTFKQGYISLNIVNNKVPVRIKGEKVETYLIDA